MRCDDVSEFHDFCDSFSVASYQRFFVLNRRIKKLIQDDDVKSVGKKTSDELAFYLMYLYFSN